MRSERAEGCARCALGSGAAAGAQAIITAEGVKEENTGCRSRTSWQQGRSGRGAHWLFSACHDPCLLDSQVQSGALKMLCGPSTAPEALLLRARSGCGGFFLVGDRNESPVSAVRRRCPRSRRPQHARHLGAHTGQRLARARALQVQGRIFSHRLHAAHKTCRIKRTLAHKCPSPSRRRRAASVQTRSSSLTPLRSAFGALTSRLQPPGKRCRRCPGQCCPLSRCHHPSASACRGTALLADLVASANQTAQMVPPALWRMASRFGFCSAGRAATSFGDASYTARVV